MNKVFLAALLFLYAINIIAQDMVYGKSIHLKSLILNEDREIWVSLPDNYNDTVYAPANYPVMYLIDPDLFFQSMTAVRDALTGSYYSYMPDMIIVGILNTDRSRDLTPTNSFIIHSGQKIYESSGGANEFAGFITKELMPYIDSIYRTNGFKLLNGHSFGGLFALNLLLEQPQVFNAYIIHDPSLWWDNNMIYKKANEKWANLNLSNITLFLSKANNDTTEQDRLEHSKIIDLFYKDILEKKPGNGLRFAFKFFEDEDHGTIFLPATFYAMKFIYDGYCLPVKKIPFNTNIIEKQSKKVSDNIGFNLFFEENILDHIGKYSLSIGEFSGAKEIFEINQQHYPQSANTYISLANIYTKQNEWFKAVENYNKAFELCPAYQPRYRELVDELRKNLE